eukprot:CAMPEP_0196763612 /NCGR_PEP_ID=MMETSP1095-20130614/4426_1 /TAXON_ID=96789 ORGANISM="Chromulina nebulosa, Strain UTEXLB2642" /NCGR_SAMPLE_ID=MMETSP1095 /ASSEMBLY_ACC=CAM_ASM_000446 /LENGTH=50 /DNA_ID=CAMNT_0042117193 /DNA_START=717 /DNA_END=869 /DNA_ORIENTATION=+
MDQALDYLILIVMDRVKLVIIVLKDQLSLFKCNVEDIITIVLLVHRSHMK